MSRQRIEIKVGDRIRFRPRENDTESQVATVIAIYHTPTTARAPYATVKVARVADLPDYSFRVNTKPRERIVSGSWVRFAQSESIAPERRTEIARKAAKARWEKRADERIMSDMSQTLRRKSDADDPTI